jgi:hypothetical protein
MFNKFAMLVMGLMVTVSSAGCCCLGGAMGGAGYGPNRCAPCNSCPPAAGGGGYYPQTGQLYQGDMSQTAYSTGTYTQSAFVPASTAALMPGAIQGAPIYNTATIPVNALPTY